jgi:hypothetical protein
MRITEYEIYAFILGAGAGSIVTYYYTTRDQLAIRAVCQQIDGYGLALAGRDAITDDQYRQTCNPERRRSSERFVSDERILDLYCTCSAKPPCLESQIK